MCGTDGYTTDNKIKKLVDTREVWVIPDAMGHTAVPPSAGLDAPDVATFDALTKDMALAAGYTDIQDDYQTTFTVDGCSYPGYPVYGDSNDWLYKDGDTFSVLIESYSVGERGGCPVGSTPYIFYPQDAATRDAVADHNVKAALAMLKTCPE